MSRKKKVSKGNPAKVSEPKTKGWKPSAGTTSISTKTPKSSTKNASASHPKSNEEYKPVEKNPFVIGVSLLIVFVLVLSVIGGMLATAPTFDQNNEVPYQVPESQSSVENIGIPL